MIFKDEKECIEYLTEKLEKQRYSMDLLSRENSFLRTDLQCLRQKERETSEYSQYLQHELLRVKCELEECKNGR